MTLWDLPENQSAAIRSFGPSLNDRQRKRLEDIGFRIGETILCFKRTPFQSPRLYRSEESVFSLTREIAEQILLEAKAPA